VTLLASSLIRSKPGQKAKGSPFWQLVKMAGWKLKGDTRAFGQRRASGGESPYLFFG